MPNYLIEGDSFFVLNKMRSLTREKKIVFNPDSVSKFSLIKNIDFYVYIDPAKETVEKINHNNFIICFLDKNVDLRLDWVKKIKAISEFHSFDPVPSTDFSSLSEVFPNIQSNKLPSKKVSLKYKGSKQNYEWFDLSLISDLYYLNDESIFEKVFDGYFDIWDFTDKLWSGDISALLLISTINEKNFEDYFNRIRETSKDYLELLQTDAKNFYEHRKCLQNSVLNNEFRFNKVREKLNKLKKNSEIFAIDLFEDCLKNVRSGSNPKLEMVKLFFKFKKYVTN